METVTQTSTEDSMTFEEALKILNIEDYKDRIFNSNSHGELFHLRQYYNLAMFFLKDKNNATDFREWFIYVVKAAEKNWSRPESIFQHIEDVFRDHFNSVLNKIKETE